MVFFVGLPFFCEAHEGAVTRCVDPKCVTGDDVEGRFFEVIQCVDDSTACVENGWFGDAVNAVFFCAAGFGPVFDLGGRGDGR